MWQARHLRYSDSPAAASPEEHHQNAVIGDQHVPEMAVGRAFATRVGEEARALHAHVLHARFMQLEPHVDREGHRDQAGKTGGEKVKNTDVFVVSGHEPAGKEPAGVMVLAVAVCGCVCHTRTPSRFRQAGLADRHNHAFFRPETPTGQCVTMV